MDRQNERSSEKFRRLTTYGWPGVKKLHLWRQDKSQQACAAAFVQAVRDGGPAPIPPAEIFEVVSVKLPPSPTRASDMA